MKLIGLVAALASVMSMALTAQGPSQQMKTANRFSASASEAPKYTFPYRIVRIDKIGKLPIRDTAAAIHSTARTFSNKVASRKAFVLYGKPGTPQFETAFTLIADLVA